MGKTKTAVIGGNESNTAQNEPASSDEAIQTRRVRKGQVGRGKAYKQAKAKVDATKLYDLETAIKMLKEMSYSSFVGTVELHAVIRKEGFSTQVSLPHSTGKQKTIEFASDATVEKLKKGKVDFDILLATADMMPKLVPFAKLLGPRGLMPNPKNGTLIKSEAEVKKFSVDKITLKTEKKSPVIHTVVGKMNLDNKELIENTNAIIDAIGRKQVLKLSLAGSMTPSVKISL